MAKNRKGTAMIYLLVSILAMAIVLPSILMNPIQVKKKEKNLKIDLDTSKSLSQVNSFISKDLIDNQYTVEKVSNEILMIGKNNYNFSEGLKRNDLVISESYYTFNIDDNYLEIFIDGVNLLFSITPNSNSIKEVN